MSQESSFGSAILDYFVNWFPRVTEVQGEQPVWATPIVTVTPRLLEQVRYDQLFEAQRNGGAIDNFGDNKGLELIPWYNVEVQLCIPAWIAHNGSVPKTTNRHPTQDGWADETFLLKYRLFSANEEHGNYIVTAFMGFSAPTGNDTSSAGHPLFTPTLAFGKGLGNFDLQSTVGVTVPDGGIRRLGTPVAYNTAFQYCFKRYLWPEFEVNCSWPNGQHGGKDQVFLTPGIVVGTIPLYQRIGVALGVGYQVAVTSAPTYNHALILSGRIPF
ncbi:MAG TPA: hypothetical protein VMA09_06215 [Candidatus Binataceae bacterium]|nr:hypothetical protein [Candidatus Binataceae bacterium]